jgi:hypothetical protein
MRLSLFTTDALLGAIESRLREARLARRNARLRRHLSRLPAYVARDLGIEMSQSDKSI